MRYIIDRFEGQFAVCEASDKTMVNIPASSIPDGCKEGTVLIEENGVFLIDTADTKAREDRIKKKMSRLFR